VKFTTLVATLDHTCGLTSSGDAYCWGKNDSGQLGDGTMKPSSQPGSVIPVAVIGGLKFKSLDAGGYHTCGVTTAGATYCWGLNDSGELGNGAQGGNISAPVKVSGNPTFNAVTAGFYHSCGLTSAGVASCWGTNLYGQLGTGSFSGPDNCPTYPNTGACSVTPVAVSGVLHFDVLALGGGHSCGLATGGVAYCWGQNDFGQLGNGSTTNSSSPFAVSGYTFKIIAAATTRYTCGITTTGSALCWGRNDVGQLGNGSTTDTPTPVAVTGLPPL
jgi:alpha-tubulin suppressor-like RCC1 family protein